MREETGMGNRIGYITCTEVWARGWLRGYVVTDPSPGGPRRLADSSSRSPSPSPREQIEPLETRTRMSDPAYTAKAIVDPFGDIGLTEDRCQRILRPRGAARVGVRLRHRSVRETRRGRLRRAGGVLMQSTELYRARFFGHKVAVKRRPS